MNERNYPKCRMTSCIVNISGRCIGLTECLANRPQGCPFYKTKLSKIHDKNTKKGDAGLSAAKAKK